MKEFRVVLRVPEQCLMHRGYKAVKVPSVNCMVCWAIYIMRHAGYLLIQEAVTEA
jgi:hypothetical protein